MQKNYRFILIFVFCVASISICAQDTVEYKEVILDGKPARLNITTGEVTLITKEDKKEEKTIVTVETPKIRTTESEFHVVQKGENLLQLSERYNVSLRDLKDANNLETTLIRQGQRLRVRNFEISSNLTSKPEAEITTNIVSKTQTANVHLVKKGETLYGLSKHYGMTVSELKQKNNLNSNLIKIGQMLNIGNVNEYANDVSIWTVSKGDTLYSIARKNGTTVDDLKRLNGLISNLISVGQKLQLK